MDPVINKSDHDNEMGGGGLRNVCNNYDRNSYMGLITWWIQKSPSCVLNVCLLLRVFSTGSLTEGLKDGSAWRSQKKSRLHILMCGLPYWNRFRIVHLFLSSPSFPSLFPSPPVSLFQFLTICLCFALLF